MQGTLRALIDRLALTFVAENLLYLVNKRGLGKENRVFLDTHPGVAMPPVHMLRDYPTLSYRQYYNSGVETARWLKRTIEHHLVRPLTAVLDWGCGTGRVIRHLPPLVDAGTALIGADTDPLALDWATRHIEGVRFIQGDLQPPVPLDDECIDVLVALDVVQMIDPSLVPEWIREFTRVLSRGGILIVTTRGEGFTDRMTIPERKVFLGGSPVVRRRIFDGEVYSDSYFPRAWFSSHFEGVELLECFEHHFDGLRGKHQVWIVRKNASS